MAASFLKRELCQLFALEDDHMDEIFLDDVMDVNHVNLNFLRERVLRSKGLILLQTRNVLSMPWVIVEVVTALENEIPIIAVELANGGYDFAEMNQCLNSPDFAGELEKRNPGSVAILEERGINVTQAGELFKTHIAKIISKELNLSASHKIYTPQVESIARAGLDAIEQQMKVKPKTTEEEESVVLTAQQKQKKILEAEQTVKKEKEMWALSGKMGYLTKMEKSGFFGGKKAKQLLFVLRMVQSELEIYSRGNSEGLIDGEPIGKPLTVFKLSRQLKISLQVDNNVKSPLLGKFFFELEDPKSGKLTLGM